MLSIWIVDGCEIQIKGRKNSKNEDVQPDFLKILEEFGLYDHEKLWNHAINREDEKNND